MITIIAINRSSCENVAVIQFVSVVQAATKGPLLSPSPLLLLVDTTSAAGAGSVRIGVMLLQFMLGHGIFFGSAHVVLKEGILLRSFELGGEISEDFVNRGVAATASRGKVVSHVVGFFARCAPDIDVSCVPGSKYGWHMGTFRHYGRQLHLHRRWYDNSGLPVSTSTALLLDLGWSLANVAGLAEVARQMLGGISGTLSQTDVVTIIELLSASHCANGLVHVGGTW